MSSQAESEIQNLQRKITLLESDLENAEDRYEEVTSKLRDVEATLEEKIESVGSWIR